MISKNVAEVLIGGKVLKLGGYESAEYLQRVAAYINSKINEFNELEGYKRQSLDYRNLLLQLNIADVYFKAKKQADKLQKEYQSAYDSQEERFKALLQERDEEIASLKKQISQGPAHE